MIFARPDGAREGAMFDFETWIAAAEEHGEDQGWEGQIGDLEILFGVALGFVTEEQRSRFFADPGIVDLLDTLLLEEDGR
jgi:hypothetical protein